MWRPPPDITKLLRFVLESSEINSLLMASEVRFNMVNRDDFQSLSKVNQQEMQSY